MLNIPIDTENLWIEFNNIKLSSFPRHMKLLEFGIFYRNIDLKSKKQFLLEYTRTVHLEDFENIFFSF